VLDTDLDDPMLVAIDRAMLEVLAVDRWRGLYDLAQGLAGHGTYFLERLRGGPAPSAQAGLARVVAHLAAIARYTDDGTCWFTAPELLPEVHRERWPDGRYDCGLAHGVAGVVAMLARAAALAEPPPEARALCEGGTRWLIAQRREPSPVGGRFPDVICPRECGVDRPSRAAWCYGDPGTATALWSAGHAAIARETAADCAMRAAPACDVVDPGLCHGSAGLAHQLARFYQATRDPVFRDGARRWFATTLDTYCAAGIAAFSRGDQVVTSLLEGAIGVALALLAATTDIEPAWDRMLLCDLSIVDCSTSQNR
jgi:hypothetical protein